MKYICCVDKGSSEVLNIATGSLPVVDTGEVLIKVYAAGINRPDILQRQGLYPSPAGASSVLGLEVSGIVIEKGSNVLGLEEGDRVCALTNGGGYSECVSVPAGQVIKLGDNIVWEQAAALPEALFTVYSNVFHRACIARGETCLVHGGSGGIGSIAIQMLKVFGCEVYTTCSEEKRAFCESMGADHVIAYDSQDYPEYCLSHTQGKGIDVILDMVGGDYIAKNIQCAAANGRIINIAYMFGSVAEVNFIRVMLKRLTLSGSTLRSESAEFKRLLRDGLLDLFDDAISAGKIIPSIYSSYNLFDIEEVREAHQVLESGKVCGKLVLVNSHVE